MSTDHHNDGTQWLKAGFEKKFIDNFVTIADLTEYVFGSPTKVGSIEVIDNKG